MVYISIIYKYLTVLQINALINSLITGLTVHSAYYIVKFETGPLILALVHVGPNGICGSCLAEFGQNLTLMTHVGPVTLASVHASTDGICGNSLSEFGQKFD